MVQLNIRPEPMNVIIYYQQLSVVVWWKRFPELLQVSPSPQKWSFGNCWIGSFYTPWPYA